MCTRLAVLVVITFMKFADIWGRYFLASLRNAKLNRDVMAEPDEILADVCPGAGLKRITQKV